MATPEEIQTNLVAYVVAHPQVSYRELGKLIGISPVTISRICLRHGVRRLAPAGIIDLSKLDFTPATVAEVIGKDGDTKVWVQGFMEPTLEVEDNCFHYSQSKLGKDGE